MLDVTRVDDEFNPFDEEIDLSDDEIFAEATIELRAVGEADGEPDTEVDLPRLPAARATPRARFVGNAAYLSDARLIVVRASDVSLSGAFVATALPDPVGTLATLCLEHEGQSLLLDAEVVRLSFVSSPDGFGRGMGLRFVAPNPAQKRFLARYVGCHGGPRRRRTSPPQSPLAGRAGALAG